MLYLKNVTITGADENTNIRDMIRLTKRFPFVEWGILISTNNGRDRYPTKKWIQSLMNEFVNAGVIPNLSYHICGKLSRDLLIGKIDMDLWDVCIPDPISFINVQRTQINVNVQKSEYDPDNFSKIVDGLNERVTCIIQFNRSNERLWIDLMKRGTTVDILFDASGGRGVSPRQLMNPICGLFCGYAGGLNPYNLAEFLSLLGEKWVSGLCWIDIESGVRDSNNDMNLALVESALVVAQQYVLPSI